MGRTTGVQISAEEVAALLSHIVAGDVPLTLDDPARTWNAVYAGDVAFRAGEWRIVIFNDCLELDYVDHVTAPDGRTAGFDDWCTNNLINPLDLLPGRDLEILERLAEEAR